MLGGDRTQQVFAKTQFLTQGRSQPLFKRKHNPPCFSVFLPKPSLVVSILEHYSLSPPYPLFGLLFPDLSQAWAPLPAHLLPSTLASLSCKRP